MTSDVQILGPNGRPIQRAMYAPDFGRDGSFSFNGNTYPLGMSTTMTGNKEEMDGSFTSYANSGFKSNGIVFSCMLVRLSLFSQVRFMYQQIRGGIPGDLFSTPELGALNENPGGPGQTLGDLLGRAIQDVDLAGNSFHVKRPDRIKRLRPDWVTIVLGSHDDPKSDPNDVDAEVIGYIYHPGGRYSGVKVEAFLPEEVCHFAPIPDPLAYYRGMSWLTPVVREIQGDIAASDFKTLYYTNGATPNLVVSFDATIKREAFNDWIKTFEEKHAGVANAYKTMYLGAGTTASRIGSNFQEGDFKAVTGATETRIVMASGLHPTIVGTADSLTGSSLNPGNFTAAARLTADKTFRFLWGNFAGSMQTIVPAPNSGSRLWYDDAHVDFLKDDEKDRADVLQVKSATISTLISAGYKPDSVVDAVISGDYRRLDHTGLFSVQLQAPGSTAPTPEPSVKVLPPEPPKQLTAGQNAGRADLSTEVRCQCGKLLAEYASPPYRMTCARCKNVTSVGLGPDLAPTFIEDRSDERADRLLTALVALADRPAPTVTISEGAIRADIHVDAPPAPVVTISDGAIRADVHVDAPPPANVTIAEGALRVDVAPAQAPEIVVHLDRASLTREVVDYAEDGVTVLGSHTVVNDG